MFAASPAAQARVLESKEARRLLRAVRRAMLETLRHAALDGPIVGTSDALMAYLFARLAHSPTEQLRVLFLNAKNRLLRDEAMGHGSIDEVPMYRREIMIRALDLKATGLILVHNHPSGDPKPSRRDVEATLRLVEAGRSLDIVVHDHIIVARSGWSSFRALGLM
ncbi:MAG: repair protein RadC [Sphingomonadales bacterium]|nr:repair protein RadC [Sphingomonadales bacterium]